MARIVIGFSGEGRGHAARVLCLVQELRGNRLLVLCPRNMLSWMEEATRHESHVQLLEIPSLHFRYHRNGKLSYLKSCCSAVPFLYHLRTYLAELTKTIDDFNPHLAIVDFEPLLPRVTRRLGITTLSLDHQHFLAALDLTTLPLSLRLRAEFLRPSVQMFCPWADAHLISSFYQFPQRSESKGYHQVGVLIRQELGELASQVEEHLIIYLRRGHAGLWLKYLAQLSSPCYVYGLEQEGVDGNLHFKKTSSRMFLRDLVTCRCLISTAGNQLIGEALAVGKPVLAIPEQGNFEQQINAHFLQASGLGASLSPGQVSHQAIENFLATVPRYRERIGTNVLPGNEAVMRQINQMIPITTLAPQIDSCVALFSAGANA